MKRILLSLGMIVFVGAVFIGATGAFFSDTETSTGNVFTSGAIDLTVDSESHYNNAVCVNGQWQLDEGASLEVPQWPVIGSECDGTWALTDLGPEHQFFNLFDLKPGDDGENTFSLHVTSNPAWACAIIDNVQDVEVAPSCTEPETEDGDGSCALNTPQDGELSDELHFFAWSDMDNSHQNQGDNVWQGPQNEPILFTNTQGPASDILDGVSYTLFGPNVNQGETMTASTTQYIGLYWCYGTIGGLPVGPLTCDGEPVTNVSQTDQLTADISFYVEQARNNPDFVCPDPGQTPGPQPQTATLTVDKIVTFSSTVIAGVDVTDFELHIDGPGPDQVVVDQIATPGLAAGVYTVSEIYSGAPAGVTFDAVFSGSCSEIGATNTGTITLVGGDNLTCTITNSVSPS